MNPRVRLPFKGEDKSFAAALKVKSGTGSAPNAAYRLRRNQLLYRLAASDASQRSRRAKPSTPIDPRPSRHSVIGSGMGWPACMRIVPVVEPDMPANGPPG